MDPTPSPSAPETAVAPAPTAPEPDPEARTRRSALVTVFLVVFIDLLGFGIVLPLLPLYGDEFLEPLVPGGRTEFLHRLLVGVVLGLLMSSFSLMQFIFAPVWGRVSDRIGRRPILLLGLTGSVVFYTLFGVASDLGAQGEAGTRTGLLTLAVGLLFVARLGAGIAGATISTAQAVIADTTGANQRARGMALIGAAFGIGFTLGPLFGFASLFLDVEGAPGYLAALLSFVALVIALRRLPETLRTGGSFAGRRHWFDWRSTRTVLAMPTVGVLVGTFFLTTLAFGGLESTLALVNREFLLPQLHGAGARAAASAQTVTAGPAGRERLREALRENFLVFAYIGFVLVLIQGFVYRRLVQRVGEVGFLRTGAVLLMFGLFGAAAALGLREAIEGRAVLLSSALLVLTVAVTGFAFFTPSVQALISLRSDPARQGEVLGVNQSGSALARILGPLAGISLFYTTPSHVLPYIFGALVLVVVFLLTLRVHQDRPGAQPEPQDAARGLTAAPPTA